MPYSNDGDLAAIRANIMDFAPGDPASWESLRSLAEPEMERDLELYWYRAEAGRRGVDPEARPMDAGLLTDPDQLKRLSCLKTLERIYLFVQKDSREADGFERQRVFFEEKYNKEMDDVAAQGVDYDWESIGVFTVDSPHRRLERI